MTSSQSDVYQSKSIIIIHPGSLNIRIGRAADLNPVTVLHAIARRRSTGGFTYLEQFLPPRIDLSQSQEIEEARLSVSHTLQACLQSDGCRRYATPPQQVAAFNRRSQFEVLDDNGGSWVKVENDIVIGNDILLLDPMQDFNIHFPFKKGDFNLHPGPGGSMTSVLADLETIWTHILQTHFSIEKKEFKNYKAVLIIPDVYNRTHLKELMGLLLSSMGFGACFLVQDHVAATFGSGLNFACVIDIGDQKTSISCVEDGICHASTRVRLDYGGADIAQVFYWLLQKCAFPYKSCNDQDKLDAMLLRKLKEDFCHVNLDICGSQEKVFIINQPKKPVTQYTIQLGDECIVAPLSLFSSELLLITGPKTVITQERSSGEPEDPFDDNFLRESRRKGMKENSLESAFDISDFDACIANNATDDDVVVDSIDLLVSNSDKDFVVSPGQILSLDQAVLQSIDRCPSEDTKRKMYGCILVVGGGMKFTGIETWLQNRMSLQIPYLYRGEQLDIITTSKDMDPAIVSWKGAAIMSCLETAPELWINSAEWQRIGVRLLRERSPFTW